MPIVLNGDNGITTPTYGGADASEYLVPVTGFKNRLINSQLLINQRGVSGTVTLSAGAYGHDRFKAGASGCTYTFVTSNNVTTLTISSGSLQQVVEGLNLESDTYTLSWAGTAQGKIGAGSYGASGITGSITGGTNTTIEFNTGTLSLPQLEKGSTATSFDYRPYGTELQLCQRYYEQSDSNQGSGFFWSGNQVTSITYYATRSFCVNKRAGATITISNLALSGFSSVTADQSGNLGFRLSSVATSTGNGGLFLGQWKASAEL